MCAWGSECRHGRGGHGSEEPVCLQQRGCVCQYVIAGQWHGWLGAGCLCVSGRETTRGVGYWGDQEVQVNCWRGGGVWGSAETPLGMCASVQEARGENKGRGSYWMDWSSMGRRCRDL